MDGPSPGHRRSQHQSACANSNGRCQCRVATAGYVTHQLAFACVNPPRLLVRRPAFLSPTIQLRPVNVLRTAFLRINQRREECPSRITMGTDHVAGSTEEQSRIPDLECNSGLTPVPERGPVRGEEVIERRRNFSINARTSVCSITAVTKNQSDCTRRGAHRLRCCDVDVLTMTNLPVG